MRRIKAYHFMAIMLLFSSCSSEPQISPYHLVGAKQDVEEAGQMVVKAESRLSEMRKNNEELGRVLEKLAVLVVEVEESEEACESKLNALDVYLSDTDSSETNSMRTGRPAAKLPALY